MKRNLLLFGIFVLLCSFTFKQDTKNVLPNNAYVVGEELDFLLFYGIMDGGKAKISLRKFP